MDRYVSLRYKGLGEAKVNQNDICQSTRDSHIYSVKSTFYIDVDYVQLEEQDIPLVNHVNINMQSQKYNLTAPNLIPYFSSEGRYMHALIALGKERAGKKSFYAGLKDIEPSTIAKCTSLNSTIETNSLEQFTMDNRQW